MYWYFLLFLSLFIVVVVVVFYFWQVARLAGGEHSSLSIETGFFFCYLLSYTQGVRVDGPWCDVQAFIHIYMRFLHGIINHTYSIYANGPV